MPETKNDRRCYKCGDKGHISSACTNPQVKCFKCHGFGHKSFECGQEVKKEKNEDKKGSGGGGNGKSTNNVHTLSDDIIIPSRRIFKDISILDRTISAFVDTGSDICAIRCDSLLILGEFDLKPDVRTLVGIGGRKITTMGNFTVKVGMDEVEMDVTFHVCKEGDILYSVVLGNDIFDEVDLVINSDGAKFRYKGRSAKVEEVNDTGNDSLMAELQSECGDKLDAQHLVKNIELENLIGTYEPTRAEDCSMKMMLNDEIPAAQMPRRMSYTDPILVDEQLVELFKEGVNKPSSSEYAAPMVLAAKIDGTKRLCCDYRRLDETKKVLKRVNMSSDTITNAEIVTAFNKLKAKSYLSVKDLQPSKSYKILNMFRHRNKYGNVVIAELEDGMLYLPKRYNSLEDKIIVGAGDEKFNLTKKLENNSYILELEEAIPVDPNDKDAEEDFFIPNSQPFFSWEATKIPRIY
ncbi:uncharacterized protein LOC135961260 [Calliphora vicina]|uniref:uncharacterized protein LOC135961260 n=1 Tax=Calliphora vicina TaxID=7373 RepID=UPI00325C060C